MQEPCIFSFVGTSYDPILSLSRSLSSVSHSNLPPSSPSLSLSSPSSSSSSWSSSSSSSSSSLSSSAASVLITSDSHSTLSSGIWLGFALAFSYVSSALGCDSTDLDWALLGSLVFQAFFFWTVVRHELRGLWRRQLSNNNNSNNLKFGNVTFVWGWAWTWHYWVSNWAREYLRNWNAGRSSIARPWRLANTASFRRLG